MHWCSTETSDEESRDLRTSDVASITQLLAESKAVGRTRRLRIIGATLGLGTPLIVAGIILNSFMSDESSLALRFVGYSTGHVGACLLLLSLMPSDAGFVRAGLLLLILATCALALIGARNVSKVIPQVLSGQCSWNYQSVDYNHSCIWPGTYIPLQLSMMLWQLAAMCRLACSIRRRVSPALLEALWRIVGITLIFLAIIRAHYCLLISNVVGAIGLFHGLEAAFGLALGLLVIRPRFRVLVHAWLSPRGENAATTAAISELLHGSSMEGLIANAMNNFSYVSAEKVTLDDLKHPNLSVSFKGLTEHAEFGDVDAFVSQSWHDDADARYKALQDFRRDFNRSHGREPRLWIDKYCVDQDDSDASLQCLPVYLAASKMLLILVGDTYLSRLWCLIELFVFLEIGGSSDKLDVRLLQSPSGNDLLSKESLGFFQADRAKCFLDEDTARLRHVVEVGFHGTDGFAQLIKQKLARTIGKSSKTDIARLSLHFSRAKTAGKTRRLRIISFTLGPGVPFIVAGLILNSFMSDGSSLAFRFVGYSAGHIGACLLLLALMPSNLGFVRVGVLLLILASLTLGVIGVRNLSKVIPQMLSWQCNWNYGGVDYNHTCIWHATYVPLQLSMMLWQLATMSRLTHAICRQMAPVLLEALWRIIGITLIFLAIIRAQYCLFISSIVGPIGLFHGLEACFGLACGCVVARPRFRVFVHGWLASRGENVATAAAISELLHGKNMQGVISNAMNSFKYVSAEKVLAKDMLDPTPDRSLRELVEHADFGQVDAFVSQSWHDDADAKYKALQDYRKDFNRLHGREPRLWIDKYCIDQMNITDSLHCLPVYLAASQTLLVLVGDTYLSRLWCLIELFVFLEMGGSYDKLDVRMLQSPSGHELLQQEALDSFQVDNARCFLDEDSAQLRHVMDVGFHGTDGLARLIKDTFAQKNKKYAAFLAQKAPSRALSSSNVSVASGEAHVDVKRRHAWFEQAKSYGGIDGARYLHAQLPPQYWGIKKHQLLGLLAEIRRLVVSGSLVNYTPEHLAQYPAERFSTVGPNMHQVTRQIIEPRTGASAMPLPVASYALLQNHTEGCFCDLFMSHAWDEGAYEFVANAAAAWCDSAIGAYICFLANPQNLDVGELVGSPTQSPFYRVLQAMPREMIMVANENTPIHSRLWCAFEAYCAHKLGIPVRLAGDPLWLVAEARRPEVQKMLRKKKLTGRQFEISIAWLALDIRNAECFSEEDKRLIWQEIGSSANSINLMIKEHIVQRFRELASIMAEDRERGSGMGSGSEVDSTRFSLSISTFDQGQAPSTKFSL